MENWANGSTGKRYTQKQTKQKKLCFFHIGVFERMLSTRNKLSGEHDVAVRVHLIALHYRQTPTQKGPVSCQRKWKLSCWIIWAIWHDLSENLNPAEGFHQVIKKSEKGYPHPPHPPPFWSQVDGAGLKFWGTSGLPSPGGSSSSEELDLVLQLCSDECEPWYWPVVNLQDRITINPKPLLSSHR